MIETPQPEQKPRDNTPAQITQDLEAERDKLRLKHEKAKEKLVTADHLKRGDTTRLSAMDESDIPAARAAGKSYEEIHSEAEIEVFEAEVALLEAEIAIFQFQYNQLAEAGGTPIPDPDVVIRHCELLLAGNAAALAGPLYDYVQNQLENLPDHLTRQDKIQGVINAANMRKESMSQAQAKLEQAQASGDSQAIAKAKNMVEFFVKQTLAYQIATQLSRKRGELENARSQLAARTAQSPQSPEAAPKEAAPQKDGRIQGMFAKAKKFLGI